MTSLQLLNTYKCRYFSSVALLTQLTSDRERPLYMTFINITFGVGTVLGPIISGAFAVTNTT